ncbi:MAG TPA: hypothetical protein VIG44_11675 [Thermomicrobiales bacterium]|jgi:hypothetical protein
MPAPWLYVRRELARDWHIPPWEIDPDELADEIGIELEIREIKARYGPRPGPLAGLIDE